MPRIRVLHVNKLYHPSTGGIEATVQELAEGCGAFPELETHVLVCQLRGREMREMLNGVAVHRTASLGLVFRMPLSLSFPWRLRDQSKTFDIVHVHFPFPLALFGSWNRKRPSRSLVVHYHCDVIRPLQKRIMSLLEPLQRRMLNAADVILVGSQAMIDASPVLQPYRQKCRVLPYPVNFERFSQHGTDSHECIQRIDLSKPVVLFVGRLVYYKGIGYLIQAMKDVEAQLVIAGDGPLRGALEKLAKKLGLLDKVSFLGSVSDPELGALYRRASVFVLPSVEATEAFGLVQVEAMLHGVPVVNTSLPTGVPGVSIDGETGFTVPPRDAVALACAITRIISDKPLRAQLSARAIRRAAFYSPDSVLPKLRHIYLGLMGVAVPVSPPAEFQTI